jgi:hypothetical protein
LSGIAFSNDGTLFLFDTAPGSDASRLLRVDKGTGQVLSLLEIPLPEQSGVLAGIDFHPDTGVLHGVYSARQDWHFTVDQTPNGPLVAVNGLARRDLSSLEFVETNAYRIFLGSDSTIRNADFGNQRTGGTISGQKWLDVNADGRRDTQDVGLAGWTIFLDLNNNGVLDSGEPSTTTGEGGQYFFTNVPPGEYTVAEVVQPGWTQTYPIDCVNLEFEDQTVGALFQAGQSFTTTGDNNTPYTVSVGPFNLPSGGTSSNFAQIDPGGIAGGTGKEIQLNNVNLQFSFAAAVGGVSLHFADQGGSVNLSVNGESRALEQLSELNGQLLGGALVRVTLVDGTRQLLELVGAVSSFAIGGQELWVDTVCLQTLPRTPGVYVVDLESGGRAVGRDFGNARNGGITGQKWLDTDGDGQRDDLEPGLPGWQIYLDLNRNGEHDPGEPVTTTDQNGNYAFPDLAPGVYIVGEILQPNWVQTYPAPQTLADLFRFEDVNPQLTFGVNATFDTAADSGFVETATIGAFAFPAGGGTGDGFARVQFTGGNTPQQSIATNNATANFDLGDGVTGVALFFFDGGGSVNLIVNGETRAVQNFTELNGQTVGGAVVTVNQVTDNLGILLVVGAVETFGLGGQEFWFDNLRVERGPDSGSGVHIVDLGSGETERGRDFGNRPQRGQIHGTKYLDFNGNGIRDDNDRGAVGWTIYLDLNNNGRLDPNEPSTVTDENGNYSFINIEPGSYHVREVQQAGFTQTAPFATFDGTQYEFGEGPTALDSGRINGDAAIDMVVADRAAQAIWLLTNDGAGKFAPSQLLALPGEPTDVKLADLDADGDLDLVVSLSSSQLLTFANDGAGFFAAPQTYAADGGPLALAIADFNNDNRPDVAFAAAFDGQARVLLNNGAGVLLAPVALLAGEDLLDLVAADFNHDGFADLAVLGATNSVRIFLNQATGDGSLVSTIDVPVLSGSRRLAVADFDADGNLDLAIAAVDDAVVYYGLSSATVLAFTATPEILPFTTSPLDVAAGDLNGDGIADLVVSDDGSEGDSEVSLFFGRVDRTFLGPLDEEVGSFPGAMIVADLNGDGRLDIATADRDESGATVLLQGPRDHYFVTLAGDEAVYDRDFGNFRNGRIQGTKFLDIDCDGVLVGTEPTLPGFTIYVDLDDDGKLDPNEPFAVTDASGNYTIDNLPPGTYSVREVSQEGYIHSYPANGRHVITIGQFNQTLDDIDFGNFLQTPLVDGMDWLYGFNATDTIYGDNVITNPCILSLGDDDHLFGLGGDDLLIGQLRNDTYHFGPAPAAGDELDTIEELEGGGTNERWDEGIYDRLDFSPVPLKDQPGLSADEPVTVDLSGTPGSFAVPIVAQHSRPGSAIHKVQTKLNDQHAFLEQAIGGAADDFLIGNARNNLLDGRAGSDVLQGAAGDDTYVFVPGNPGDNDQIVETIGSDTLDFSQIPDPVTVDLETPPILTTAPVIAIWGLPQQTVETPAPGLFENIVGTVAADTLRGSSQDNKIFGGDAADLIIGLAGDDELAGQAGNDTYRFADGFGVDEVIEGPTEGTDDFLDFSAVTIPLNFVVGTQIKVSDSLGNEVSHAGLNIERLLGGGGLDTLTSGDGENLWIISGPNTGTLNGVAFTGIESLVGGIGDDTFVFLPGGSLTGSIDAGLGDDTFDFRQGGTVAGTISGGGDNDTLLGNDANRTWSITGLNAGTASGIGPFDQLENLVGGAGIDTFALSTGGRLTGGVTGGDGTADVLTADDLVPTTFRLTGDDEGLHTDGVNTFTFAGVENLTGGGQADRFELDLGSLSGAIAGGLGADTLVAADVPTTFTISAADAGTATRLGSFAGIENLIGNSRDDEFVFSGGTLSGAVDGGAGSDTIVGDNVANAFNVTGADAGTATGILGAGGFTNVENLTGNSLADTLMLSGPGALSGVFRGEGGLDVVQAPDVPNLFITFGPTSGFLLENAGPVRLGGFVEVESLVGNSKADEFLFFFEPFAGKIDGGLDTDRIVGGNEALEFTINAADAGSISGVTTFVGVEQLTGGLGDDSFTFTTGGTLAGSLSGGDGEDTLIADAAVATTFTLTGPDAGTMAGTSVVPFDAIENLTGGGLADSFLLTGGTLSGTADGAAGVDTLAGDNLFNIFQVQTPGGGLATGYGAFAGIENLVGGTSFDVFWLDGGALAGSVDGGTGSNRIVADDLPTTFTVDGADSGQATGIAGGFTSVGNLWGGTNADTFIVAATGSLTGLMFGDEGDDQFQITPALGATFSVFGGSDDDTLTIDPQDGVATELPGQVTIAPGGASISHFGVETVEIIDAAALPISQPPAGHKLLDDVDGDGKIDLSDFGLFKQRLTRAAALDGALESLRTERWDAAALHLAQNAGEAVRRQKVQEELCDAFFAQLS